MIKDIIKKLVKKYGTRDPIRLAREMDIQIIYSELGNIGGYCIYSNRIRCICVNSSTPDHHVPFIVAHELGHIFLHPNRNTPYLHHYTHTNVYFLPLLRTYVLYNSTIGIFPIHGTYTNDIYI